MIPNVVRLAVFYHKLYHPSCIISAKKKKEKQSSQPWTSYLHLVLVHQSNHTASVVCYRKKKERKKQCLPFFPQARPSLLLSLLLLQSIFARWCLCARRWFPPPPPTPPLLLLPPRLLPLHLPLHLPLLHQTPQRLLEPMSHEPR